MRFVMFACGVSLAGLGLVTACSSPTIRTLDLSELGDGGSQSVNGNNPKPGSSGGTSGTTTSGGTSGTTGTTACDKACAAAASAKCSGQSSCVSDCEAQEAKVPASCKTQYDAVQACAATAKFKCSSTGKATIASGCDTESNALVTCLTSGGSSGSSGTSGSSGGTSGSSGSSGSSGGANCGSFTTGSATCDSCQTSMCCAQGAACTANTACGDIIDCISTMNCTTQACVTQCEQAHSAGTATEQAFIGCMQTKCSAACQ
jgi:hypothetical protein